MLKTSVPSYVFKTPRTLGQGAEPPARGPHAACETIVSGPQSIS